MSIDLGIAQIIATVLNQLLTAEPWASRQLQNHAEQQFVLALAPFQFGFAIDHAGHLNALALDQDATPAVTISLGLGALFSSSAERLKQVRIEGEVGLAQSLGEVAQKLRPDPEQALAELVGDIAARRISMAVQTVFTALSNQSQQLANQAVAALTEPADPLILARAPFAIYCNETRALRDQLERLAKRIDQLERP